MLFRYGNSHIAISHVRLFRTTHSEDRLGGLFHFYHVENMLEMVSHMPTTESITTPHIHTRAVSRRPIN